MPNSNHLAGAIILGLKETDSFKTWVLKILAPEALEKYALAEKKLITFTRSKKAMSK
jgi:hypothetical protein